MSKNLYESALRDLASMQQSIGDLQQQKANLQNQGQELQAISQLNGQIQDLQARMNGLQLEHTRLQAEYDRNLEMNQNLSNQIENIDQQISPHLQSSRGSALRDLASTQQSIGDLQQQKANLQNQGRELQAISQLDSQIQNLQARMNRLQSEHTRLEAEYNRNLEMNQNLSNQIESLTSQANRQISESSRVKNVYDDCFASIDSILSEFSEFSGQKLDTTKMVVQALPKSEMHNSKALKDSCEKKSKQAFDELLERINDVNATDSQGMTLLMYSLKHGFWYGVDKLLSMEADVNVIDNKGCNALMYACAMPRMKYVIDIARKINDIDHKSNEANTALFYLCRNLSYLFSSEKTLELINHNVSKSPIVFDGDLVVTPSEGTAGLEVNGLSFSVAAGEGYITGRSVISMSYSGGEVYSVSFTEHRNLQGSALEYKISTLVETFLALGAQLDAKCMQGLTPLFIACAAKNKLVADFLINKGASLTEVDNHGFDALMWAIEMRDPQLIQKLISKGANINHQDNAGKTLLFWMVDYGWSDMIEFLMRNNADPNLAGPIGAPLALCASKKDLANFKIIINYNRTDINFQSTNFKITPLWLAAQNGVEEMVDILISKRANLNLPRADTGTTPLNVALLKNNFSIFTKLVTAGADYNCMDVKGTPILHYAVELDNSDATKALVAKGAAINCQDALGKTPFYLACLIGKTQMMLTLKDLGADINILNRLGFHPIHAAIHNEHIEVVEKLLNFGVGIDTKSTHGYTPLQHYCELPNNKVEVVEFLLAKGASLACTQGETLNPILYSAVLSNNLQIVELLLEKGGDINALNNHQVSPLYCSIGYHGQPISIDMVELLLRKGVSVNQAMYDGDTPMHMAGYSSRFDIMEKLLRYHGNVNAVNHKGETPLNSVIENTNCGATAEQKILAVRYLLNNGGIIGKGKEDRTIREFLEKVQAFENGNNELVQQDNLTVLLHQSQQKLTAVVASTSNDGEEHGLINYDHHSDPEAQVTGDIHHNIT